MNLCRLCGSSALAVLSETPSEKLKSCYQFDTGKFFPKAEVRLLECLACGMQGFCDALPGDSDFYDQLQQLPNYYDSEKAEFAHALGVVATISPAAILDVGAGNGLFLEKLKEIPAMKVRASELSQKSLISLGDRGIKLDGDGDRYDLICSFQLFEHVVDLPKLLSFCDDKLLPGGHLLVSVPNPDSPLFSECFIYLDYPPHHFNRFTRRALESIGRHLGYESISYWQEAMRIEHWSLLVKQRREKLVSGRLRKLYLRLGALVDAMLLPLRYGSVGCAGHSHTMVYRKPGPS